MARRLKRKYVELQLKRGRFIECQGCPTVDCSCFTELEDELLQKTGELLTALGCNSYAQFAERTRSAYQSDQERFPTRTFYVLGKESQLFKTAVLNEEWYLDEQSARLNAQRGKHVSVLRVTVELASDVVEGEKL